MNGPLQSIDRNLSRLKLPRLRSLACIELAAITFDGQLNIHIGEEEVELFHYGPAHTSGDVIVYFPRESVGFIGDLVFVGHEPLIENQKGGNS